MRPAYTVIAYLNGKPDKRTELVATLLGLVGPTRAEAGCVEYRLHVSNDDPNKFVFYENWMSSDHFDEHMHMPHLRAFWSRRSDLLAQEPEIQLVTMMSEL